MADEQLLSLGARLSRRSFLKFSAATLSVASLGVLLSACGEDEEESEGEGGTGAESSTSTTGGGATGAGATTTTVTDGEAAEGTEEGEGEGAGASGGGENHVVEMNDQLKFDPETITIKVGDSVTWTTVGAAPHTSTGDPSKAANAANVSLPDGAEPWDSGMVNEGGEFTYTFEVPGEYKYICIPHELAGMLGTVVVEE